MRILMDRSPRADEGVTFPKADPDALQRVGELIYKVTTDQALYEQFRQNPVDFLRNAGVTQKFLDSTTIQVVRDTSNMVHIIVPNEVKPESELTDPDVRDLYMKELGFVVTSGCRI